MQSSERTLTTQSFKQILRTYMLRMLALTQQSQKFSIMHPIDEMDQYFSRFMYGYEIKQSTIYQLTNVEIRSDQQCLMVMTLLYDLAKWIYDDAHMAIYNSNSRIQHSFDDLHRNINNQNDSCHFKQLSSCQIEPTTVQCVINQSLNILKLDKKHQTVQLKHNQLIRILLQMIPVYVPIAIVKGLHKEKQRQKNKEDNIRTNQGINTSNYVTNLYEFYVRLYDMVKDVKDTFSAPVRQEIRRNYNKGIEDSIKSITSIIQFSNIQTTFQQINKHSWKISPKLQIIIQILTQTIKYISHIHSKSCQDLYKLVIIFNTVYMNVNAANVGNGSVGTLSNQLTLPQNLINSVFPQLTMLYGGNYSQVILSRIKIIKNILQILILLTSIKITKHFDYSQADKLDVPSQLSSLVDVLAYNQQILHKSAHILIKVNGYVRLSNYYLFGTLFSIYEKIMKLLLKKQTMVPLYMFTHFVMNNLRLAMQWNSQKQGVLKPKQASNNSSKNIIIVPQLNLHPQSYLNSLQQNSNQTAQSRYSQLIVLQTLLSQISNLFLNSEKLQYFLKLYDWNFMEEDICLNSIKYLYEFIEDSGNQGRVQYDLFKKCLSTINKGIQQFLNDSSYPTPQKNKKQAGYKQQHHKTVDKDQQQNKFKPYLVNAPKKQRKQFYELKKKQYLSIVQKINTKPKQIFKIIKQYNLNANIDTNTLNQGNETKNSQSSINNQVQLQIKQEYIQKCVRILKKSNHIEQRAMIDIMASIAPESNQILQKYIQNLINYRSKNNSFKQKHKINRSINSDVEHFLRYMISNFFLSGEAQQIVRFIDKITQQFFKHQPEENVIFKHSDSVYTFANAIILLNSDQHNPKNPRRMSLEDFMKMCENINNGQNLPYDIIKNTYKSIKQSQIHTFRNRYNMEKISLQCWLDIVNDYQSVGIDYYDSQMAQVCMESLKSNSGTNVNLGFKQYANQLLLSVIDEKETQKLEVMVERFEYDDRKFDCEIIQKIRVMIVNKKHIAMHVLQKIFQQADFANKNIDQKMISYCWLASGIIQNFYEALPFSKIAEYLLKSWRVSFQLKDNLFIRQNLELKAIKKYIKQWKNKQSKKSIINMFSKFFGSKDSQNQQNQQLESPKLNSSMSGSSSNSTRRRANITNSSFSILKSLMKTKQSRTRAAQAVLLSLRHQQSRRFQQFVGCLYLIFHFVFGQKNTHQIHNERKKNTQINEQCIHLLKNILNDFYCITQSHKIGGRIDSLKTKNIQKYELVYAYTQFWTLKILFTWSIQNYILNNIKKSLQNQNNSQVVIQQNTNSQKFLQIYRKCITLIKKINSDLLIQLTNILDIEGVTCKKLIEEAGISKQIVIELCNAVELCKIQPKFVKFDKNQMQQPPVQAQKLSPTLKIQKQAQNIEQVQKYMQQLTQRAEKQQNLQREKQQIKQIQTKQHQSRKIQKQCKIQQDIEQKINKQLGLMLPDQNKQSQESKYAFKKIQKAQGVNKKHENPQIKQFQSPQQKNGTEKQITQKKTEQKQSNGSGNEQLALPIYML